MICIPLPVHPLWACITQAYGALPPPLPPPKLTAQPNTQTFQQRTTINDLPLTLMLLHRAHDRGCLYADTYDFWLCRTTQVHAIDSIRRMLEQQTGYWNSILFLPCSIIVHSGPYQQGPDEICLVWVT